MDWQVIILTLGAALITGLTSVIGNILVVRSSLRKSVFENKEQKEKEFMTTRISAYTSILVILRDIDEHLDESEMMNKYMHLLESKWLANYAYLSININRQLNKITNCMESEKVDSLIMNIHVIRKKIKEEIDEYYNIKDKDDWEIRDKHIKRRSKFKL